MAYDTKPKVKIKDFDLAVSGYEEIVQEIKHTLHGIKKERKVVVIECYPGVRYDELEKFLIQKLNFHFSLNADSYFMDTETINEKISSVLTDDRVFGIMSHFHFDDFFLEGAVDKLTQQLKSATGNIVVYGVGASAICKEYDMLIYCDLSRWEIQCRHRNGMPNWKANNNAEDPKRKFKRGYFFEWRIADRQKQAVYNRIDYLLDTTLQNHPKMISGTDYRKAVKEVVKRPFRVVPYFDQAVWGGQWLKRTFKLDSSKINYGWGFDGLPEENSLIFQFGDVDIEIPAINVVFAHPTELLGEKVHARFGKEFPIRFDMLDTVGGGNLSLQVHPLVEYIQDQFGMHYTQDESYYILHSETDSSVYLGLKKDVNFENMVEDLRKAEKGNYRFPDEKYINNFHVKRHDHCSIPAGTIHCQGKNTVVLEISSTPYIFTFKLWDWDRIDFDGKPRPIHLNHGLRNIVKTRDTDWVKENLIHEFQGIPELKKNDHIIEKTGLHSLQFLETRRHWFDKSAVVNTHESVNMLNLVEGEQITVESVDHSFEPFTVHYAETFIIPASIQRFKLVNHGSTDEPIGVMQAFVRNCE